MSQKTWRRARLPLLLALLPFTQGDGGGFALSSPIHTTTIFQTGSLRFVGNSSATASVSAKDESTIASKILPFSSDAADVMSL